MSFVVSLPPRLEDLASGARARPARARQPDNDALDPLRSVFWQAFRHLFPPDAVALQNEHGAVLISWSMAGDPHATSPYAAPIMLRFEPELIELMELSDEQHRRRVTEIQEQFLRAGLVGYDPYATAKSRVVVLG